MNDRLMPLAADDLHRPWPAPKRAWLITMCWRDLLFAHWPIKPNQIRPLIPPAFELDTIDGQAWIGVVPFRMTGFRVRGMPWGSAFPEINLRTYVKHGDRSGVYFFSLDTPKRLAVWGARRFFALPYYRAQISCRNEGQTIHYQSRRTHAGARPARFRGTYQPVGEIFTAQPGSLAYFLTERYALYTVDQKGRCFEGEIHHAPWPLQRAQGEFTVNQMTRQIGLELPDTKPVLHFARKIDTVAWSLKAIS